VRPKAYSEPPPLSPVALSRPNEPNALECPPAQHHRRRRFQGTVLRAVAAGYPGQEFVETTIRMAVDDLRGSRREIGAGIDIVEFASLDQRTDHGPMFRATIGAGEQRILAIERDRPDVSIAYQTLTKEVSSKRWDQ
jgi:hypothetical protein